VEELVAGLVVEAAAVPEEEGELEVERRVVRQGDLQDVHLVVPGALERQVAHRAVPGLEALASLMAATDPLEQMDYLLSPMVPVQVPAFRGVPA
jgi:hypothetical protein